MKTVNELKKSVNERFISCCGENAAIFVMTAALFAFTIILWMILAGFVSSSSLPQDISGGIVIILTQILLIAAVLLLIPFLYGVKWYRIQQVRGNNVPAGSIFRCYASFKRMSGLFKFSVELTKKQMRFILPIAVTVGIAMRITIRLRRAGGMVSVVSSSLMLLLIIAAVFAGMFFNCRYAAAGYLYVLDPEIPPKEIIRISEEISKGKTRYLMEALLSVLWWMLTFVFVFPIIFALPYIEMVNTAAVNELITDNGEENTDLGEEQTEDIEKEHSHS